MDKILREKAIEEIKDAEMYEKLSLQSPLKTVRDTLVSIAREERRHHSRLLNAAKIDERWERMQEAQKKKRKPTLRYAKEEDLF